MMPAFTWCYLPVLALLAAPAPAADARAPGHLLRGGMHLVYEADGAPGQPWVVERVDTATSHQGQTGVTRIEFAPREPGAEPEVRLRHRQDDLLYGYSADVGTWSVLRPVGPDMTWTRTGPDGRALARYTTAALSVVEVGPYRIDVVETTVETLDEQGAVTRRLRESYAPGLETATGGVFEVPDPDRPGEWRATLTFTLVEIRP